jgi:hypothetical protein
MLFIVFEVRRVHFLNKVILTEDKFTRQRRETILIQSQAQTHTHTHAHTHTHLRTHKMLHKLRLFLSP